MTTPQPTPGLMKSCYFGFIDLLKYIYLEFKSDYTFAKTLVKALFTNIIGIIVLIIFVVLFFFAAKLGGAK